MSFLTKNEIIDSFQIGDDKAAWSMLKKVSREISNEIYLEVISLEKRLSNIRKESDNGEITREQYSASSNRIQNTVNRLISDLPEYQVVDGQLVIKQTGLSIEETNFYRFLFALISYFVPLVLIMYMVGSYIYDDFSAFVDYAFYLSVMVLGSVVYSLVRGNLYEIENFFGLFASSILLFYLLLPFFFPSMRDVRFEHLLFAFFCLGVGYVIIWSSNFLSKALYPYFTLIPLVFVATISTSIIGCKFLLKDENFKIACENADSGILNHINFFDYFYATHFSTHDEKLIFSIAVLISITFCVFVLLESLTKISWRKTV